MSPEDVFAVTDRAVAALQKAGFPKPRIGLVLGSGLAHLKDLVEDRVALKTDAIPGYPKSTVEGHSGCFYGGQFGGMPVLFLEGRIHGYEGYPTSLLGLPARIAVRMGAELFVTTNAAGGVREDFEPGDMMLFTDHLNLSGTSPLTGANDEGFGDRFPDMTEVYPARFRTLAQEVAQGMGHTFKEGVYAWVNGPQYETPAEVRMIRTLGADAVGMSTVPECIAASHMKTPVFAVSVIANRAAGLHPVPLAHEDVLAEVKKAGSKLGAILAQLLPKLLDA